MQRKIIINVILATLFFLAASFSFGAAVWYFDGKLSQLQTMLNEIAQDTAQERRYAQLEAAASASESERAQLSEYIFAEGDTIQLLNRLEVIAGEQNLTFEVEQLNIEESEEEDEFRTLVLSWEVSGSRSRVVDFVKLVERLPYKSQLVNLVLRENRGAVPAFSAAGTVHISVEK